MLLTRAIPCLLIRNRRLVKTVRFSRPTYLGDPVNTCKLFNDKEVDELVILDIGASKGGRGPDFELIAELASECFMPLGYGGGIRTIDEMRRLFACGVEKVIINTAAHESPALVCEAASIFGAQSVIVSLDVRRRWLRGYQVMTNGGTRSTGQSPVEAALTMQERGAGEILLTSIERDGTMAGFDLELVRSVTSAVTVPVVACGGAGSVEDLGRVVRDGGASAAGAGSLFVFQGPHRAVLISYPEQSELQRVFGTAAEREA